MPAFASLWAEERTLMRQQIQGGLASLIAESVPAKPAHSHGDTREKRGAPLWDSFVSNWFLMARTAVVSSAAARPFKAK
jgi:uncharacterized membrane protein